MTHEYTADLDENLFATLELLAEADPLNDWIYDRMRPHLGQRVLEVGCGIGTYTTRLVADGRDVVALDPSPAAVERCKDRLGGEAQLVVGGIEDADVGDGFDSLICLNVLEHIEDDRGALEHMRRRLRPGGRLLLLVPQGMWLFGTLDVAFGHHRRYRRRELRRLLDEAGFDHDGVPYFNLLGIPGWFVAVKLLRLRRFRPGPLRIYRWLMPPFRKLEDTVRPPIGLSLFTVATKR